MFFTFEYWGCYYFPQNQIKPHLFTFDIIKLIYFLSIHFTSVHWNFNNPKPPCKHSLWDVGGNRSTRRNPKAFRRARFYPGVEATNLVMEGASRSDYATEYRSISLIMAGVCRLQSSKFCI